MKNKKILALILCLILILSNLFCVSVFAESPKSIQGSRKIVLTVDRSDLNNYVNGGQSLFDYLLRDYAPYWLKFSIKTDNRDINISLEFDFTSIEDLKTKSSELIGSPANISCFENDGELFFLEGYSAYDMVRFVYQPLSAKISYEGITLEDLFKVKTNQLLLNKKIYNGGEFLEVFPKGEKRISFSSLSIETDSNTDGFFVRTLKAKPEKLENQEKIHKRFKNLGKAEIIDNEVLVSFEAASLNELNEKTASCLYIACGTKKEEEYLKGTKTKVKQTEFFGLDKLLAENGSFYYQYNCPDYYKKIGSDNQEINVEGTKISTASSENISYYYERDFEFNTLDVKTDLTNRFGKIKKTITLSAPTSLVEPYHSELKKCFDSYVKKGVTLSIYDEGSVRHYAFSYSSFFQDDVNKFTESVLGSKYSFEINDSWIPFAKSKVTEKINISGITELETPPIKITATYVVPKSSKLKNVSGKEQVVDDTIKSLTCNVSTDDNVRIEYSKFNIFKCIIEAVCLVVIIILIVLAIKLSKRVKNKLKEVKLARETTRQEAVAKTFVESIALPIYETPVQTVQEELPQKGIKYCAKCGAVIDETAKFCCVCGQKTND